MDKLLSPDIGLMIWTIFSFLILVFLLRAFAWGPLLASIDARDNALREERERAEKAREESEKIQRDLEARLAVAAEEAKGIVGQASKDAEALRSRLKADAEDEARGMIDKTRVQLEDEKNKLIGELRREVADLSLTAAERLIKKSVDPSVKKTVMDDFFSELEKQKAA
ncbi:MAG: ATP synthase F0 subunit B [Elusimicrobia bacterium CG1_02_63_36]|nr:MAG: ATP synthase F0 subunit B [Elusimicrobia bacterium CG1_02_63_36]PIP81451.1 MAG: ATP synthase F0 subunit B [Elusimicrobia bacterium CG22_combo_CG10-13_8_21_14_all_63_91]PJA17048.1 MAG: ATP synthase F0 subunit B [Elusimicrobia bacterium CG_4_10_14_0_2_um_filter_63_34]PJB25079.1 MAG: ATP synthase F0 subunit B [Elusimicrobia bacterium CG_4_9_14_3_um_filter_62_55]